MVRAVILRLTASTSVNPLRSALRIYGVPEPGILDFLEITWLWEAVISPRLAGFRCSDTQIVSTDSNSFESIEIHLLRPLQATVVVWLQSLFRKRNSSNLCFKIISSSDRHKPVYGKHGTGSRRYLFLRSKNKRYPSETRGLKLDRPRVISLLWVILDPARAIPYSGEGGVPPWTTNIQW